MAHLILITKENGFDKIHTLQAGESPLDYINKLDNEHIILTPRDDMRWYEMIIENGNK